MPRGRPATHQSAEEKKAARSAENQRAYVKKKLKLQANALGEPVTGTFITHDAASLLNENAAAGILLPVPQDVGILTNNLDLLDIAIAQSQDASFAVLLSVGADEFSEIRRSWRDLKMDWNLRKRLLEDQAFDHEGAHAIFPSLRPATLAMKISSRVMGSTALTVTPAFR